MSKKRTKPDELATFAAVSWNETDITDNYDVTEAQARGFLARHERTIQERMTERGWDAIDELAHQDNLPKLDVT